MRPAKASAPCWRPRRSSPCSRAGRRLRRARDGDVHGRHRRRTSTASIRSSASTSPTYEVVEHPVRHADRQGGQGLRDDPRSRRRRGRLDDGKTWTYKLRPNLKWSDGQPLTSADVAYTINRSRKEAWLNYTSTIENITATAPNPRTVVLHSLGRRSQAADDGRLHRAEAHLREARQERDHQVRGADGVGSGPFTLEQFQKGQFVRMKANPNYWQAASRPSTRSSSASSTTPTRWSRRCKTRRDRRRRERPDGVVQRSSRTTKDIRRSGQQGGFDELALNAGAGLNEAACRRC